MLPIVGFRDQVTAAFELPVTLTVKPCMPDGPRDTLPGNTDTPTGGTRVTLALASFVGSAVLTAVTVTLCCEATYDGAV